MTATLASRAGSALLWKGVQLVGVKLVFLARILILARILSPDDFGLFAVATVALEFLLAVTNTGMIPALVQREGSEKRHYDAAWTVGVGRALLVGGAVFAAAPWIASLFHEPRATALLRVIALRPLLEAGASIRVTALMRELRFRSVAVIRMAEAAGNFVVSVALAPWLGVWALVLGALAGSAAYIAASYREAPYRPRLSLEGEALRPLVVFGRWIFAAGVLAIAGGAVLQLAISRRLGAAELGLYYLAAKLAFLPAELADHVLGSVAFPLYSRLQSNVRMAGKAFRTVLVASAAVVVPVSLLLIALAPSIVADLLGPRWAGTESLIRILTAAALLGLLGDATVPFLKGAGLPARVAAYEGVHAALVAALVWGLADRFGVAGAAFAWIPAVAAAQVAALLFLRAAVERPFAGAGPRLACVGLASAAGAGAAWGLDALLPGVPGLLLAAAAGAALTAVLLWSLDRRLRLGLVQDLLRAFPQAASVLDAMRVRP